MTTIKKTRIGTSDIEGDICTNGLALFPAIGTLRAGISMGQKPKLKLLSAKPSVWVASLSFSVSNTVKTGVCGPGYGVAFDLDGEAGDTEGKFTVSNDWAAAGFFIGHAIEPSLDINLRAFGKEIVKMKIGKEIDLIAILIAAIKQFLAKSTQDGKVADKPNKEEKDGITVGLWGMYDQGAGDLGKKGELVVRPSYDFPMDIASKLGWMGALLKALRKVGAKLTFGPGLSTMIPVTVKLEDVQYGDTRYTPLSFQGGTYKGTAQAADARAQKVSTGISHAPGFDIGLYLFVSLKVGKWFKVGKKSPKLPLLQFMGIEKYVTAGPFHNCLGNDEGATSVSSQSCSAAADLTDLDVVLDPGGVPA